MSLSSVRLIDGFSFREVIQFHLQSATMAPTGFQGLSKRSSAGSVARKSNIVDTLASYESLTEDLKNELKEAMKEIEDLTAKNGSSEEETKELKKKLLNLQNELGVVLSQSLISMPESFDDRLHFPMVVDGTHCMIYEPMHELYPMDRDYFSHKHHTAAYAYQLTLSTRESKILSIHGPFPAGKFSDKAMWRHTGMEAFMVAQNKRAIADGGYEGMKGVAIPMRRYHSKLTGIYFRRNRARVERLMGYFKNFAVLDTTFRIRKERLRKHEIVFRAVAAIVATQLATENPIFAA